MLQHESQCLAWTISYSKGTEECTVCPKCFSLYFWVYYLLIFNLSHLWIHLGLTDIMSSLPKTLSLLVSKSFSSASAPKKPFLWLCYAQVEEFSIINYVFLSFFLTESHWGFKLKNIFIIMTFPSNTTHGV